MRSILRTMTIAAASLALTVVASTATRAASNTAFDKEILSIAEEWAKIKYTSKSPDQLHEGMDKLGSKADDLVKRYPDHVEAMIWDGIITSERASLTWGLTALNLATRARDVLIEAEKRDPKALDAGAPTSLGVLYYRVPGFPIGWGDNSKARALLTEAVQNAPYGRDAHYFYADFLYEQGEYAKAEKILIKALALPPHPERPVWDKYFPLVMKNLLARVRNKM
jgi:tetratricopeptide (TPR) repeat protein